MGRVIKRDGLNNKGSKMVKWHQERSVTGSTICGVYIKPELIIDEPPVDMSNEELCQICFVGLVEKLTTELIVLRLRNVNKHRANHAWHRAPNETRHGIYVTLCRTPLNDRPFSLEIYPYPGKPEDKANNPNCTKCWRNYDKEEGN